MELLEEHVKLRALVVDDSEISRRCVCRIISSVFTYEEADNGLIALQKYREGVESEHPFDIVFMDVIMPEMDGKESVKQIRAFEQSIDRLKTPIIMISASEMLGEVEELVNGLLRKVVNKQLLNEILQNLFSGRIDML